MSVDWMVGAPLNGVHDPRWAVATVPSELKATEIVADTPNTVVVAPTLSENGCVLEPAAWNVDDVTLTPGKTVNPPSATSAENVPAPRSSVPVACRMKVEPPTSAVSVPPTSTVGEQEDVQSACTWSEKLSM